eukprot:jgi/Psemu1/302646/fgenesh1_kg.75_\
MATLLKLSQNTGGRTAMNRNLFSASLQRRAKRNLPMTTSQQYSRCHAEQQSTHWLRENGTGSRKNLGMSPFPCHNYNYNCYSTTRSLRRSPDDKSNLPSSSSSSLSFLDRFKHQAESALESSKAAAEKAAKNVTEKASSAARDTAKTVAESAQQAASKTLESTQKAALRAKEQAIRSVSDTAATAKKEGSKRLSETAAGVSEATGKVIASTIDGAKQKLSEGASGLTKSTSETISKSTRAIGSGVEEQKRVAAAKVEKIAESSKQLKESVTMTGTKVLKMFWWWSLAAIFVYGVASTLPMAVIKYTMEEKKKKWTERQQGSTSSDQNTSSQSPPSGVAAQASGNSDEPTINAFGWNTKD